MADPGPQINADGEIIIDPDTGEVIVCDDCTCGEACVVAWTEFFDCGGIAGGQDGALREYADPASVSNPLWTVGTSGLRFDFEDSADDESRTTACGQTPPSGDQYPHGNAPGPNCASYNHHTQTGRAIGTITLVDDGYVAIDWFGVAEVEDSGFENMRILVDGDLVARATSPGGDHGCDAPEAVVSTPASGDTIFLAAGVHTIQVDVTTGDSWYHVDCYYEFRFRCGVEPRGSDEDCEECGTPAEAAIDYTVVSGCSIQFTNASTPGSCGAVVSCYWTFEVELEDGTIVTFERTGCSVTVNFSDLSGELGEERSVICPENEPPIEDIPLYQCGVKNWTAHLRVVDISGCEAKASETGTCGCEIPDAGQFAIYSFSIARGDGTYDVYARVLVEGPTSDDCGPLCASVLLALNIDFGSSEEGPCLNPDDCTYNEFTVNTCACQNIYEDDECDGGLDGTETYPPVTGNDYGLGVTLPYPDNPYTEEEVGALPPLDGCAYVTMYRAATNCCGSTSCYEVVGSPSHVTCCS